MYVNNPVSVCFFYNLNYNIFCVLTLILENLRFSGMSKNVIGLPQDNQIICIILCRSYILYYVYIVYDLLNLNLNLVTNNC